MANAKLNQFSGSTIKPEKKIVDVMTTLSNPNTKGNISDIHRLQVAFTQFNIRHFTAKEVLQGWDVPEELLFNIIPTIRILDSVRAYFGIPFYLTSTYRDKDYNKAVKGKKDSLHLVFNAIDFTVSNHKMLPKIYKMLDSIDIGQLMQFPFLPKTQGNFGLGLYPTFIHLDTRSTLNRKAPARW